MGARGPVSKKEQQLQPIQPITDTQPPDYLDDVAKGEWVRLVRELKTLSNLDITILALHCQAVSDHRRYSLILSAEGERYTTPSGQRKFNPEYQAKQNAWGQVVKTAAELGFTPNARARMNVQPSTPKTDQRSIAEAIADAKKGNKAA